MGLDEASESIITRAMRHAAVWRQLDLRAGDN